MDTKKWLGLIALSILSLFVITSIVSAVSPDALLVKYAALGLKDTTPVVWVNEGIITRGTIDALANIIMSTGVSNKEESYQDALDLLIQNSLFLQEAKNKGLLPTDEEVDTRVQYLIQQANGDNKQLKDIYVAQAAELGTTWDSPEFRSFLVKQTKDIFPAEKLNIQIDEQVQGDQQKFNEIKTELLSKLFSSASIRLDSSVLPEEAKNIHVPQFSELPINKPIGPTIP